MGIAVYYTILTILAVMVWMTGVSIIVYEFFREFRGARYDSAALETDTFMQWKKRRSAQYKKGIYIMIIGFSLHALLFIIPYIVKAYFTAL